MAAEDADQEVLERKIAQGFTKLSAATKRKNHKKALKCASELLELVPDDGVAKHCKLVALIHLGQLEKAYAFAKKKGAGGVGEGLEKEKAYSYYRNGHLSKALDMVKDTESDGVLELKGQLLYRLGRMEESKAVYEDLLSKQKRGILRSKVNADLLGNIIAAYLAAGKASEVGTVLKQLKTTKKSLEETPEIAYNNACISVALGQYEASMDLLEVAERVGYESLYEDGLGEDEIREELAHIFAQKAYVHLKLGEEKESLEGNLQVLKNVSPEDITLAIATNNLVASRGNANIIDSLKKFEKLAKRSGGDPNTPAKVKRKNSLGDGSGLELAPEISEGLAAEERVTLLCNYAIVSLLGNRTDAVEQTARTALSIDSASSAAAVLRAVTLVKKGSQEEAWKVLDDFCERNAESAVAVSVAKCEIAASCGKWKVGARALTSLPEEVRFQPACLATIASLLDKAGEKDEAGGVLAESSTWWEAQEVEGGGEDEVARYASALKIAAQFKYETKDLDGAARLYEKILQKTQDGTLRSEAMAGLVQLHGVDDSSLADKYEAEMPAIPGIEEIDVELLETTTVRTKAASKTTHAAGGGAGSAKKDPKSKSAMAGGETAAMAAMDSPDLGLGGVAARVSKAQVRREFLKTLDPERQAHVLQRRKDAKKAKRKRKMKDKEYKEAVDSERWIPKRDRTNYKKTRREKKKDKNVVKGSQGAGKVNEMLDKSSAPIEAAAPTLPARGRRKR